MDKLTWTFELLDRMSRPATAMDKALEKVDASLKRVQKNTRSNIADKFGSMLSSAGKSMSAGADQLMSAVGAMAGPAAAAAAVVGGLAIAGGKWMLDSLIFKENTTDSLEAMLGSKEAAEEVFKKAAAFAQKTPFSNQQVGAAFEKMIAAGFKTEDLDKTMASLGDFAGADAQKLERALMAISQIKGKGKLQGEELMQLAEMGLPMQKVYEALAKTMGKTTDEVQRLLSSGQISADQGIGAIMATIDATFGGRMEKAANSIQGLWSTLTSAPGDVLMKLDMAPMIEPIRGFLKTAIELLGPDAPGGRLLGAVFTKAGEIIGKVAGTLQSIDFAKWFEKIGAVASKAWPMIEKVFAGFGKAFGLSDAGGSLEKVLDAISERLDKMDPAAMEKLGVVLGYVVFAVVKLFEWSMRLAMAMGTIVDAVLSFWSGVADFSNGVVDGIAATFDTLPSRMLEIGLQIVQGLLQGLTGGMPSLTTAVDGMGQGVLDQIIAKFDIGSPSRVMAELGGFVGQGFTLGLEASGMNQSIANPISASQIASVAGGGGSAPAPLTIGSLTINIGEGVKDAAQAREHGKAAAESFGAQLTSMLRGFATEGGG